MGIIDRLFKKQIDKEVKKAMTVRSTAQSFFFNSMPVYGLNSGLANIDTYITSDDVYSVIRRIAKTAALIPLYVYKVKDENALKEYQFHQKKHDFTAAGLIKKEVLRTKALEMVDETNPLQKLIDNPNPEYSRTEFKEGVYTFRLSCGNTYIYAPSLELGPNAGRPAEMWLMPSQNVQPVVTNTFPRRVVGYEMTMGGIIKFQPAEIIHIRYFNPNFTFQGDELVGLSPLKAGSKLITRKEAETDYSVNAFQNSGIAGIVSNESFTPDEVGVEQLGKMKADFYSDATGKNNARKLQFQVGKVNYTAVGLSPVDMDVLNSEIHSFKKLCNLFGISDILFNNSDASTESNVKEMIAQLYTNAALPEVYAYRDQLNKDITPAFNKGNVKYYIDCDISGITELQDDMKMLMEAFAASPIMIPNLILEAMNYGKSPDPLMDKVYVKTGYTDLDSIQSVGDLPVIGDGN